MSGEERRSTIIEMIRKANSPVSGTKLAETFQVSRQVVVQDIALLRAAGWNIIATNRGYVLSALEEIKPKKVFKVNHSDEETEKELQIIVDYGGTVKDVFVWHKVYGKVEGELNIDSRRKVAQFMEGIRSGKSSPLKNITSGYHYHTVLAPDQETLEEIQQALAEAGFLVEENDA